MNFQTIRFLYLFFQGGELVNKMNIGNICENLSFSSIHLSIYHVYAKSIYPWSIPGQILKILLL